MLRLNNVEVVYDRAILVLKGISLDVPEQRIITLLGSNGAGKSTTLKAGSLSGGEQQMLAIGRALMARPKLMLLDEPSLGLAPLLVEEIFQIIQRLNRQEKLTVLLVEQNAAMALTIAEHGYIMENGRIVLDGPVEALRENPDVKEFYLGLTEVGARKSYRDVKHYKRRKRWLS